MINSFLICRDELLDGFGERDARITKNGTYALLRSHALVKDTAWNL